MSPLDPDIVTAAAPPPRAYIAGPMRGYCRCNFDAFDQAAAAVRAMGWEVVSPADHDRETGFPVDDMGDCSDLDLGRAGFDLKAALRWDIGVLIDPATTDIIMLPGWAASSGARLEWAVARAVGLRVWRYIPGHHRSDGADTLYPMETSWR